MQPTAGDAGGSLGAALALWHIDQHNKRKVDFNDSMKGSYLGTEFKQDEIEKELKSLGAKFETLNNNDLLNKTSDLLSKEMAIGWFQGRMEFGPRV